MLLAERVFHSGDERARLQAEPTRTSSTFEALNRQTGQQWFLVSGEEKAEAVARALADDGSIDETPARGLTCENQTWYLDSAAASRLG